MHVEDAPATVDLATHGHAMADDVIARGVDGIVVGIPNGITEHLDFVLPGRKRRLVLVGNALSLPIFFKLSFPP